MVERVFSWLAWIAAVLWIVGLLPVVMAEMDAIQIAFGKSRISLLGLIQGALSAGVVLVLALWISATVEKRVLSETLHDLSLRKVATNIVRAVLLLVGLLFALSAVGVDLTALSVLGGAIGVGLGFGLQKLAANYVSGFVILFERSHPHRRHGQGGQLRGRRHGHQDPLHADSRRQRARVHHPERENDHRAGGEPVAGRHPRPADHRRDGRLRQRSRPGPANPAAARRWRARRVLRNPAACRAAGQARRRRARIQPAITGSIISPMRRRPFARGQPAASSGACAPRASTFPIRSAWCT